MVAKIKGILIKIIEPGLIEIESFTRKGAFYTVDLREKSCSCPDFKYRGRFCKHLRFAEENRWQIEIEEKVWRANREFEKWREEQAPALAALKLMHTLKSW